MKIVMFERNYKHSPWEHWFSFVLDDEKDQLIFLDKLFNYIKNKFETRWTNFIYEGTKIPYVFNEEKFTIVKSIFTNDNYYEYSEDLYLSKEGHEDLFPENFRLCIITPKIIN